MYSNFIYQLIEFDAAAKAMRQKNEEIQAIEEKYGKKKYRNLFKRRKEYSEPMKELREESVEISNRLINLPFSKRVLNDDFTVSKCIMNKILQELENIFGIKPKANYSTLPLFRGLDNKVVRLLKNQ